MFTEFSDTSIIINLSILGKLFWPITSIAQYFVFEVKKCQNLIWFHEKNFPVNAKPIRQCQCWSYIWKFINFNIWRKKLPNMRLTLSIINHLIASRWSGHGHILFILVNNFWVGSSAFPANYVKQNLDEHKGSQECPGETVGRYIRRQRYYFPWRDSALFWGRGASPYFR